MTKAALSELANLYDEFLLAYNWLLTNALGSNRLLYHMPFKVHALWHVVDQAKYMNPAHTWAYMWEDFMGRRTQAAKACVGDTSMSGIGKKVFENWLFVLQLRLSFSS